MYPIVMTYYCDFSCKGCPNRYPGCHGECETYKKERAVFDEKKAELEKYKEAKRYSYNTIADTIDAEAKLRKSHRGYRYFRR